MKLNANIPKSDAGLENDFEDCRRRKRFIEAARDSYGDYLSRAKDDFLSAKRDFDSGDLRWTVIKAYQSVFFSLNAVLVKQLGFFSKDHKCLLTSLLKAGLLDKRTSEKITDLFDLNKKVEDADVLRQERNVALYHPNSNEIIAKADAENSLAVAKEILNLVVGALL